MFKHYLRILSILALVMMGLVAAPAAAQSSCAPRTDWIPYRVAYGDTLLRIAARYGTVVSTLAAGNCLNNINLIFVGQVLKVPPRPDDAPAEESVAVPVTFQQFERGFMIWRVNTGDIWVYFGQSGGRVRQFTLNSHSGLPANPVTTVPPGGRYKPDFGFGKVWGNFPSIRSALGWATTPESSFIMSYSPTASNAFYFTLPDGWAGVTVGNNLWSVYTGVFPGATTQVTVTAAFQSFEGGFMLWRQDTGRIEEFHNSGYVAGYNLDQYAYLSDTPIPDVPPPGLFKPISGIGRVWTHFIDTRDALRWATWLEQGFEATFVTDLGTFVQCVTLPNGISISYPHFDGARSYTWEIVGNC